MIKFFKDEDAAIEAACERYSTYTGYEAPNEAAAKTVADNIKEWYGIDCYAVEGRSNLYIPANPFFLSDMRMEKGLDGPIINHDWVLDTNLLIRSGEIIGLPEYSHDDDEWTEVQESYAQAETLLHLGMDIENFYC